jgi:hypothetical protein
MEIATYLYCRYMYSRDLHPFSFFDGDDIFRDDILTMIY